MGKIKEYFRWLFTRGYLYGIASIWLLLTLVYEGGDMLRETPTWYFGLFIGYLLQTAILISIIKGLVSLFRNHISLEKGYLIFHRKKSS